MFSNSFFFVTLPMIDAFLCPDLFNLPMISAANLGGVDNKRPPDVCASQIMDLIFESIVFKELSCLNDLGYQKDSFLINFVPKLCEQ